MAQILLGAPASERIRVETVDLSAACTVSGRTPTLAVLRLGDDAADIAYENSLGRRCQSVGVGFRREPLSGDARKDAALLARLNDDPAVHGILPLQPLPHAISEILAKNLCAKKDVDGISLASMAALYAGGRDCFVPCTAAACMEMLRCYDIPFAGKRVVIVGRSLVVGKPLAMLALAADATVTVCHSKTAKLKSVTKSADIVVTAIGRAEHFDASYFSAGQTVLDVGTNFVDGRQCGDVRFGEVSELVAAITPVPKGIGSVTTALLLRNVALSASREGNT